MFQMFQITTAMRCLLVAMIFLATLVSASSSSTANCEDFFVGACDLSEDNIVDRNMATNTPGECQVPFINIEHI